MKTVEFDRELDLKRQSKAFFREGHDVHNRKSGLITIHDLRERRARRRWHMMMKEIAINWEIRF